MRQRLGKYELVTLLSVGGMAELHLAFAPGPGGFRKVVALKHVLPDLKYDERFIKMFLDEARLTAALSHPNVGQVFDLGEEGGDLYLAMEFIAGVTLNKVLLRAAKLHERLPVPFSCRVARDAALGLHHAHSFKDPASGAKTPIIHRDVTPSNVMVTFDGVVKVIDFGIAKARGRLARTQKGMLKGTLPYMAPEQLLGRDADARSDLFALGVVLWELLAGRELFFATTAQERLREPVIPLEEVVDVPPALAAVVMKALATDPDARFASTRELARAIEAAVPQLANEEQLGGVVTRLFPDTRGLLDRLLAMTQQTEVDEEAISALVKRLRKSEQEPATEAVRPAVAPAPARPTPEEQHAPPPPEPGGGPGFSMTTVVPVLLGVLLAAFGGLALWRSRVEEARPVAAAQPLDVERVTLVAVNAALADGDPQRAEALLSACRVHNQPCKGLEGVRKEVLAQIDKSDCGPSERRRLLIDAATRSVETSGGDIMMARAILDRCRVGRILHPDAKVILDFLDEPPPETMAEADSMRPPPEGYTHEGAKLYAAASVTLRAGKREAAAAEAETCVQRVPGYYHCYELLGRALLAGGDRSAAVVARARAAYVDYLRRAPASGGRVEAVKKTLQELE